MNDFVHLGTGNYNDQTAKTYTDHGYITTKRKFGIDATNFFNYLSGYTEKPEYHHLVVAPDDIRGEFIKLIDQEIEFHKKNNNGHIIAKMNSLTDKKLIMKLYEASSEGVKIELIIRGICCLKPGIKEVSENIRVISIVGRLLEHSRIYYFHHNGEEKIYLSSADMMTRNMEKRVEILFPNASAIRYLLGSVGLARGQRGLERARDRAGRREPLAERSQRLAAEAMDAGRIADEIVGVTVKSRKGETVVEVDEASRAGDDARDPREAEGGRRRGRDPHRRQRAGSQRRSRGGGRGVGSVGRERRERPLAKICPGHGTAGNFASLARTPGEAALSALKKVGKSAEDLALGDQRGLCLRGDSSMRMLGVDDDIVNVNGGAIAFGHPIGASGSRSSARSCTSSIVAAAASTWPRSAPAAARATRL